jgi:hypothetical protein
MQYARNASDWEINASGVCNRFASGLRPLLNDQPQLAAPFRRPRRVKDAETHRMVADQRINHLRRVETLETLDQLSDQHETFAFASLSDEHQRRSRVRDPLFERRQQVDPDVGVAYASQRLADSLEAGLQIVNARPARLAVEQWQQFTNAADCHARRMDSFGLSIQNGWKLLLQIKNLCMKQRGGCDSF